MKNVRTFFSWDEIGKLSQAIIYSGACLMGVDTGREYDTLDHLCSVGKLLQWNLHKWTSLYYGKPQTMGKAMETQTWGWLLPFKNKFIK